MHLTDEEEFVRRLVVEFVENEVTPIATEYEQEERFPWKIIEKAGESDLTAPTLPERYGGADLDLTAALIINEEFHRADPGIAETVTSVTFGCESILSNGTEEQKEQYVSAAADGRIITGLAMTEPSAGSDFSNIQATAERDESEYVLNGEKVFISNGSVADVLIVFARTSTPDKPHRGISSFIVETETAGLDQQSMEGYVGPATTDLGQIFMDDVRVPVENRLGEEGEGFYQAMEFLDEARLEVAASAIGSAQGALDLITDYITERRQFGEPIASNQAIRHRVADLASRIETVRAFVYQTGRAVEEETLEDGSTAPAMAKLQATQLAEDVASEAVQLHGGYGCFDEYRAETFFRASKAPQIYEGTNEILRGVIANSVLES